MGDDFPVVLTAGSLRADPANGWLVPHAWTDAGVVIEAPPNGAGVLHVAVALCVLNDTFREARDRGLRYASAETWLECQENPNPSQHNLRRAGLTEVHTRPHWVWRDPAAS